MIASAIDQLAQQLQTFPVSITAISSSEWNDKKNADAWSRKEILGHLIDSATVNLTRFVVGQFENNPTIKYDQNAWCKHNYYEHADIRLLVDHWLSTNRQILFIW